MKLSISNTILQGVVRKLSGIVSTKSTLPILTGVLVEATEKAVLFTGSKGSETIIVRVAPNEETCIVTEPGKTVLQWNFFDVVKKLTGLLDIELIDTNVKVSKGKTNLSFAVMNADEYPRISNENPLEQKRFTGHEFEQIISKTAFNAATSDSRPVLQSVHATFGENGNRFVCTDSHRLGLVGLDFNVSDKDVTLNIPASSLVHAQKTFDFSKDVFVLIFKNQVAMANGDVVYYSQFLEGNYPLIDRLIPQPNAELVLNRQEVLDTINLLQGIQTQSLITFEINGLFLKILAKGELSNGESEICYESYTGEDGFKITLSAKYMIEALKAFDEASVKIEFAGNMRPLVIKGVKEDTNSLQLVLPIRSM